VVLAGGQSSRMGQDKSQLLIDGQTMLKRSSLLLESCGLNVAISSAQWGVADELPDLGPLGGIYTLLKHQQAPCLFIPTDLPKLSSNSLAQLISHYKSTADSVYFSDHYIPLIVSDWQKGVAVIEDMMAANRKMSVRRFIAEIGASAIATECIDELMNMNTPEDYANAKV